jgi:hypothetical protein
MMDVIQRAVISPHSKKQLMLRNRLRMKPKLQSENVKKEIRLIALGGLAAKKLNVY